MSVSITPWRKSIPIESYSTMSHKAFNKLILPVTNSAHTTPHKNLCSSRSSKVPTSMLLHKFLLIQQSNVGSLMLTLKSMTSIVLLLRILHFNCHRINLPDHTSRLRHPTASLTARPNKANLKISSNYVLIVPKHTRKVTHSQS